MATGRLRAPVTAYVRRLRAETRASVRAMAPRVEERMRREAPWRNETGAARAALYCRAESAGVDQTRLVLGYDPRVLREVNKAWNGAFFYPLALEGGHAGRYAILRPTADRLRSEIGRTVSDAIRRVR